MRRVALSGGRRRRSRARRSLVAVLLTAAVILVALAASVGSGHGGGRQVRVPARPRAVGPVTRLPHRPARARRNPGGDRTGGRAIDRVLRSTPLVTAGIRRRRVVALTFDDGPSPYTAAIVRTLVRMRVPATFFVVGQQLRYFSAGLRDELRHGFEVGDHTVNHPFLPRLAGTAQAAQIMLDEQMLRRTGAPPVRLFRPPYGAYNRTTLSVLARLHMLMVLWSSDPGDWRRPGARAIVTSVMRSARPGTIVILHDGGGNRTQTIAALPAIIRGLRRRGLRLVSVPTLLALDPPPRHQHLPRMIAA